MAEFEYLITELDESSEYDKILIELNDDLKNKDEEILRLKAELSVSNICHKKALNLEQDELKRSMRKCDGLTANNKILESTIDELESEKQDLEEYSNKYPKLLECYNKLQKSNGELRKANNELRADKRYLEDYVTLLLSKRRKLVR
jgi:hypothetical protein